MSEESRKKAYEEARTYISWYNISDLEMETDVDALKPRFREHVCHFLYGENSIFHIKKPQNERKKIFVTFHQPPSAHQEFVRTREPLKNIDGVIVVGTNQIPFFSQYVDPSKIFFIPHGVDVDFFRPDSSVPKDPNRILFVGNWLRDFETLRNVAETLKRIKPGILIEVVTHERNRPLFEEIKNIRFCSGIPEDELISKYRAASLLLMPMKDCTANNSVLEGMACGLPIIATDIGGMRDYVDDNCAILCNSSDAEGMAYAAADLLEDKEQLVLKGRHAREKAELFSWPQVAKTVYKIYEDVFLKARKSPDIVHLQTLLSESSRETERLRLKLSDKKSELAKLRHSLSERDKELSLLKETQEALTLIHNSFTWTILRKYDAALNLLLPAGTGRRLWYNRIFLAVGILLKEGWGSLWLQIKQALKQPFISYDKVDELTKEELEDGRARLMIVIPTMEMGGAERCASILLEHLNRRKLRPELVTIFDRKAFYLIPCDVKINVLEKLGHLQPPSSSLALPLHLQKHTGDLAWLEITAFKLSEVIAKRRPSIILAQDYFASIITALAKKNMPVSIKLILSTHNSPSGLFSTDQRGGLYAYLVQTLFSEADNIIAVSNGVVQELITAFKQKAEKISVLHNPIDLIKIQNNADEDISEHPWFHEDIPIMLFVGRLAPYKGLNYLFKALTAVRELTKLRCVIIGEGEEKDNLIKLAKELGITEDVTFLGKQQNPFKFMRRATIFVLPSLTEGLPYVLVEALACGCPIIATDSPGGGPAEILKSGAYGLLIPPGDENALSDAMLRLLRNDELRNRFSATALERAKDFDLDKTVKAYEDIILGKLI